MRVLTLSLGDEREGFPIETQNKKTNLKESGAGVAVSGGKKFQVSDFLILKNQ